VVWKVRAYEPGDERSWLRCRVLGFLDTAYFDDVWTAKPSKSGPDLVAVDGNGTVAGILTTSVRPGAATVDTVVVHPDFRRQGIGRALLDAVVAPLRAGGVAELDAWTRDDPGTLGWYRGMGLAEDSHYLHVYANRYADGAEPERAGLSVRPGLKLMAGFLHGTMADEAWARANFRRVHVCRRFVLPLASEDG
jgi:ribosomal protein S18 acetylase RimI-like enzyme